MEFLTQTDNHQDESRCQSRWLFRCVLMFNKPTYLTTDLIYFLLFYSDDRDWKVKVCKFLPLEYEESGMVNSLDDPLMYHCPYGMHIYNIKSHWHDHEGDRICQYNCQTGQEYKII